MIFDIAWEKTPEEESINDGDSNNEIESNVGSNAVIQWTNKSWMERELSVQMAGVNRVDCR